MALAYDLIILLDPNAEDDAQAKVLSDVEASIAQAGGTIANNQDWARRSWLPDAAQARARYA